MGSFNKEYVKTEIFPRMLGRKIAEAEESVMPAIMMVFYIATREEAEEQIATAGELIQLVEKYCMEQLESPE